MNRRWFLLLFILLLALALRLVNLGGRSLWYDEAFAVLFSEKGLSAMLYGTLTPVAGGASDIHPLLYYSTLNVWMALFGETAFAVRLLSVVLGAATVGMMYVLAKELFSEKTALATAFITAVAPFHVQYSQETRMYALLGFLLVTATWCFIKGWRGNARWWLAFGLLAALAMYTQQLAAFYLAALGLVPLVTRHWKQFRYTVLGAVIAVIVYLPWLVNLPGQFHKIQSYYWIDKPGLGVLLRTMFSFLVVNLDIPKSSFAPALIVAAVLVIFLVVQIIVYLHQRRAKPDRKPLFFVLWLAVIPVVLMWLVSQIQPVYLERSLLPSALMLYLALGWMFASSRMPRVVAGVVGIIGLGLVAIGLYYQYTWATFPNSPFQSAAEYIRANWQSGDIVVHQNKISALPMIFYDRDLPQRFIGDTPGSADDTLALPTQQALNLFANACVQSATQGSPRIWWVVFDFAEQQYAAANRSELQTQLDWLNAHYTALSTEKLNDLDVVLFGNPHGDLGTECEPP